MQVMRIKKKRKRVSQLKSGGKERVIRLVAKRVWMEGTE